jgi:hypothetical protein
MDGDGLPNVSDPDMDGDGFDNDVDPDTDGDGILNGVDPDVDGDGILNGDDSDVDGDQIDNIIDPDVDGDGILNEVGLDPDPDIDGDGEINLNDPDVDGDGFTNGFDPDVDGDGFDNGVDPDVDGDGIPNGEDGDIDGDGIPNELDTDSDGDRVLDEDDDDADGDGVLNEDDSTPGGRQTSVGVPTQGGGLRGAALNCFEADCNQDEKKEFFEDLIEQQKGGLLGEFYQGVQANIVDFIVRLYENGYSIDQLTADSLSRGLAMSISGEVLILRGNITDEQIEQMTNNFFPDVKNVDREGKIISMLAQLGVIGGYPDGNFYPLRASNLVEGAKVIVNTAALVSENRVGSVLQEVLLNEGTIDWFFPFLKTLDQLNISLISEKISGYQDYETLGLEMDIISFLLLFDKLSEIIGIDDVLSFNDVSLI